MKILDTTFLIDILRGNKETEHVLGAKEYLFTTQINMYEVIRGLFLKKISSIKFLQTLELFETIKVLPLDDNAIVKSAEISAGLIQRGEMVADCDCLIAGTALSKGVATIVTRNDKDFRRIHGLVVETY